MSLPGDGKPPGKLKDFKEYPQSVPVGSSRTPGLSDESGNSAGSPDSSSAPEVPPRATGGPPRSLSPVELQPVIIKTTSVPPEEEEENDARFLSSDMSGDENKGLRVGHSRSLPSIDSPNFINALNIKVPKLSDDSVVSSCKGDNIFQFNAASEEVISLTSPKPPPRPPPPSSTILSAPSSPQPLSTTSPSKTSPKPDHHKERSRSPLHLLRRRQHSPKTMDSDPSLDLFTDVNKTPKTKVTKSKATELPQSRVQEVHPLMLDEDEFSEDIETSVSYDTTSSLPTKHDTPEYSETVSLTEEGYYRKPTTRRQKYRLIKESLINKASKAYKYWYPRKEHELKKSTQKLSNTLTETSTDEDDDSSDSFLEIDSTEVDQIGVPYAADAGRGSSRPPSYHSSPLNTDSEDGARSGEMVALDTTTYSPIHSSLQKRRMQSDEAPPITLVDVILRKYWFPIMSVVVAFVALVAYIFLFSQNTFLQGAVFGAALPLSVGYIFWAWSKASEEENTSRDINSLISHNLMTNNQYVRLRSLGKKAKLKDFFQYTENQNFADLKFKNVPYRYIKLKGSILEAYELNCSKDIVPNPTVLSPEQIKEYGLKLVFRVDISGWLVSVEAPPGMLVTAHNMWKKRYPIWLRRETWRRVSSECNPYATDTDVSSFYLFTAFSRYKELWYETLVSAVELGDKGAPEKPMYHRDILKNYTVFMQRLFNRIPHVDESGSTIDMRKKDIYKKHMKDVAWINAILGRFMWNILNDIKWDDRIKDRIVRKLQAIQVNFISSVELINFSIGDSVPLITKTYLPKQDTQGTWCDMELHWTGEISMTLSVKFKTGQNQSSDTNKAFEIIYMPEDDDPMTPEISVSSMGGSGSSGTPSSTGISAPASDSSRANWVQTKLMKMIDRVEVSAKVTRLTGRICVNIPPPPTDCLWYGFKSAPDLSIDIRPRIKGIDLSYHWLTKVLSRQLKLLFEETFVLPAMENIVIPGMARDLTRDSPPSPYFCSTSVANSQDLLDVASPRA